MTKHARNRATKKKALHATLMQKAEEFSDELIEHAVLKSDLDQKHTDQLIESLTNRVELCTRLKAILWMDANARDERICNLISATIQAEAWKDNKKYDEHSAKQSARRKELGALTNQNKNKVLATYDLPNPNSKADKNWRGKLCYAPGIKIKSNRINRKCAPVKSSRVSGVIICGKKRTELFVPDEDDEFNSSKAVPVTLADIRATRQIEFLMLSPQDIAKSDETMRQQKRRDEPRVLWQRDNKDYKALDVHGEVWWNPEGPDAVEFSWQSVAPAARPNDGLNRLIILESIVGLQPVEVIELPVRKRCFQPPWIPSHISTPAGRDATDRFTTLGFFLRGVKSCLCVRCSPPEIPTAIDHSGFPPPRIWQGPRHQFPAETTFCKNISSGGTIGIVWGDALPAKTDTWMSGRTSCGQIKLVDGRWTKWEDRVIEWTGDDYLGERNKPEYYDAQKVFDASALNRENPKVLDRRGCGTANDFKKERRSIREIVRTLLPPAKHPYEQLPKLLQDWPTQDYLLSKYMSAWMYEERPGD